MNKQPSPILFSAMFVFASAFTVHNARAQNLTLEGQTGGFITPTAYVVQSNKGQVFSHPAVGFHYVHAGSVIGDIMTGSVTEGIANRVEFGYTRSAHTNGDNPYFSSLWEYPGMNVFHGKAVVLKEDAFGSNWTPGVAAGFVVRTGDHFVSGSIADTSYTNGDIYVAVTKTALNIRPPLLVNIGWKATNASIYGIGGQATRFGGRFFGGVGIPLPGPWHTAIVPAAGFTQEPYHVKNLAAVVPGGGNIPTTLDYAVRITQRENPRFSFDIGAGQVAGQIGYTELPTPAGLAIVPVNLEARDVFGIGLSYKF
ncbi:DUF3034 family protein [Acidicapsa dinghuensis]|uniref:DUF3034 family protein n=1 Tax=Acidicapsa dinghuensis TaxID=2218256 RepID=A0ABW1EII7_9BACT|nr:DUF3034 family protein [Acidicapsa dinghuensis]